MAIYAYTGPPGSGKSYAVLTQVIIPGVRDGRRVVTNLDGIQPRAVQAYCAVKWPDANLGEVVTFHGEAAQKDGFWPHETQSDASTFVKAGDLVVFDEWKMYFPRRGKMPTEDVELFLRWHRHLTNSQGVACDVCIATQLPTDIHGDFRGLLERSFKFMKLKTVGLAKAFTWKAYEGHLQNKETQYTVGHDLYDAEVFPLYKTSAATGGGHSEAKTDSRTSAFPRWLLPAAGVGVLLMLGALWFLKSFFAGEQYTGPTAPDGTPLAAASGSVPGVPAGPPAPPKSPWRITGQYVGEYGLRVVLTDDKGGVRFEDASLFQWREDRPFSGVVDGLPVRVEDRLGGNESPIAERIVP